MGCFFCCCLPEEVQSQNIQSKKMEQVLKDDKKKHEKEITLLLLGTAEAGKSTFIRQMKILYENGFDYKYKKDQITNIHQNIVWSMKDLVGAMKMLKIEYENRENAVLNAELIKNVDDENSTLFIAQYLSAIKDLWNDSGIQKCFMRSREYQLNDSTKYYLSNIDRIAQPGYIPTEQDVLRVRVESTGIVEHTFMERKATLRIIDVGGQRSERRKWMHFFNNITSIIFLAAISEYDQVLREFSQRNRLKESKIIFDLIRQHHDETSIILFLNKTDLLEEKIMYSHLEDFFPDFKGSRQDYNAACKFIREMFLKNHLNKKNIYTHFTCATDTNNIKVVFNAVRNVILQRNMKTLF